MKVVAVVFCCEMIVNVGRFKTTSGHQKRTWSSSPISRIGSGSGCSAASGSSDMGPFRGEATVSGCEVSSIPTTPAIAGRSALHCVAMKKRMGSQKGEHGRSQNHGGVPEDALLVVLLPGVTPNNCASARKGGSSFGSSPSSEEVLWKLQTWRGERTGDLKSLFKVFPCHC